VWTANIACIFTLLNLLCGFYAMMMYKMSLTTMDNWALGALLVAFGCDFLDGWFARKKNQTSAFGERLDSLSDLISFGMAPMYFALSARHEWEVGLLFACGLYLVCGAVRLARYDPESQGKIFKGMPIPIAGLTLASFTLASRYGAGGLAYFEPSSPVAWFDFVPGILGLLMISDIPFFKVSFAGPKKWMPITLGAVALLALGLTQDLPFSVLAFTVPYMILCLVLAVVRDLHGRLRAMQEARSAIE
jgi:CDP-diacylglycerol--serine O-phosphatidyltransferase